MEQLINSGSYNEKDVTFLLKNIEFNKIENTDVSTKEQLIQNNKMHYSEMITKESKPTKDYLSLFNDLMREEKINLKFSKDILNLAYQIFKDKLNYPEITIVSLARAGTPIGVLINRILKKYFNARVYHYSVSIIRDKGLDLNAMKTILNNHMDKSIVFVDGWTGKGVIGNQLKKSISEFNLNHGTSVSDNLYVVADISGTAYYSASFEDYLIPNAVLNSTVSGLVSRTILRDDLISIEDYHGAIYYKHLEKYDSSLDFIEDVMENIKILFLKEDTLNYLNSFEINLRKEKLKFKFIKNKNWIEKIMDMYNYDNINYIKPGVGESTRVLLRRQPKELWVKSIKSPNVAHLVILAKEKNIIIKEEKDLTYEALAIIEHSD